MLTRVQPSIVMTRAHAVQALGASFGAAGLLNLIEFLADPDGWPWWGLRLVVAFVFTAFLGIWVFALIRERRTRA